MSEEVKTIINDLVNQIEYEANKKNKELEEKYNLLYNLKCQEFEIGKNAKTIKLERKKFDSEIKCEELEERIEKAVKKIKKYGYYTLAEIPDLLEILEKKEA